MNLTLGRYIVLHTHGLCIVHKGYTSDTWNLNDLQFLPVTSRKKIQKKLLAVGILVAV